ncbi:hypothetical protein LOK49_LG03G02756, partial [Camellia lanceoleosa]
LWVYVYFPTLAPEMEVAGPLMTPFSLVFEGQHRPRPRETLFYLRQYFDTVRTTKAVLGDGLRFQYAGGSGASQYRILLEGPVGRAWFLGERFLRQVWGYISQDPPAAPPATMWTADRLSTQEVVSAMQGTDALLHLTDGDYATYRHTYLMPPLTGARTPSLRPVDVPSLSQARATDIPSSSRAGTSRGGGGSIPPIPPTLHHPGWPDMPTELTSWRFGTPYQVSLKPSLPDHRYVRDPDSPPPPVEYMDEMLGMLATFEGMILRREAQLAIIGVQVLRRAHVIEAEPDEEEEEEVTDRQSETSAEEGDSGLGSGSGDEAEGDPEDDSSDPDGDDGAELWVYVYFPTLAPELITWQPWAPLGDGLRFNMSEDRHLPKTDPIRRTRLVEHGFGERFASVWGTLLRPSAKTPRSISDGDRLSSRDVVSAMLGTDALLHLEEGDYATYRHVYLMPPLTGVRTPSMRPIGVPSSSQARATDIPSSNGAGTSRGGGGSVPPIPPTLHHPGWPDMLTELTCWRFGPPVEYVDEMLGVMAAFEGMILRREAQLAIMGVQ